MKLAEWLVSQHMTQAELSRSLGVSQPAVHLWLNGVQSPSGQNMMRLYKMSGGKVGLKDWCEDFCND